VTYYVGVLDGCGDVWGVRIPDIPGCVGGGETPEAAIADAAAALRDVAVHRREGGFSLPQPTSLTEAMASGEIGAGESAVMIPLLLDSGRTVRANVSFDAALLEAIDAAAKDRGLSRSAFLASAARGKIASGSVPSHARENRVPTPSSPRSSRSRA
jgi:predicted RNase H-like HicB family nuclease